MKKFIRVATVALFFNGTIAHAVFIEGTDPNFGIDSITIDTDTGLAWLDMDFTAGRSYVDVASELGAGGDFEGYRHATHAELFDLFDDFGFAGVIPPGVNTNTFFSLFGTTGSQSGFDQVFGWGFIPNPVGVEPIFGLDFFFGNGVPLYDVYRADEPGLSQNPTIAFPSTGSWLVRRIPEPGTIVLLALGLAALIRVRGAGHRQI